MLHHYPIQLKILRLTIPVIIANITTPFVGLVDTAVMGHLDSAHYIGAVAMGSFLFGLLSISFGFLRMATTGLVAQAYGADNMAGVILHGARGVALAAIMGVAIILIAQPLIVVAGWVLAGSAAVKAGMAQYITIVALAAPAVFFNMVGLGVLFGLQKMKAAMAQLIIINLVNIIGNLLLVFGFGLRIEGVALATVIAQYSGTAITLWLVVRALNDRQDAQGWNLPKLNAVVSIAALKGYIGLGRDLTIRTLGVVLGQILVLNSSAALGDVELAASQLCFVLFGVLAYGLDGFAHAAESLVGEAIGRKDRALLATVITQSIILAFVMAVVLGFIVWAVGGLFFRIMTDLDEVLAVADGLLIWMALLPPIAVLAFQMDGVFIGATEATVMRNAMLVSIVLFIPALVIGYQAFGLIGIWSAFLALLALRGITLWLKLDRVFAQSDKSVPA